MRHALLYLSTANKEAHGKDGLLYEHTFGHIVDQMVFTDEKAAKRWLRCQNDSQACNEMASDSYHTISGDVT
jgi:hypothetical protein